MELLANKYVIYAICIAAAIPFVWLAKWWMDKDNPTFKMPADMLPRSRDFSDTHSSIEYWLKTTGLGNLPVCSATLNVMSWLCDNNYTFWSYIRSPDYGYVYNLFRGSEGRKFYKGLARYLEQFPYPYTGPMNDPGLSVSSTYLDIISKERELDLSVIVDARKALSLIYCAVICTKTYRGQWEDTDVGRIGYRLMNLFLDTEPDVQSWFYGKRRSPYRAVHTRQCLERILSAAKLPALSSIVEPVASGVAAMDANAPAFPSRNNSAISRNFALNSVIMDICVQDV